MPATANSGDRATMSGRPRAVTRAAATALWRCTAILIGFQLYGWSYRAITQNAPRATDQSPPVIYSLWLRNDLTPPRLIVSLKTEVATGDKGVTVQMPAWSPGDYHVQNFGKYVQDLHAEGISGSRQTGELHVRHPDANTWQIDTGGAPDVLVTYSVPETPPEIFSDNVTLAPHYAFVNGPSAFAYVVGHKTARAVLNLYQPTGWQSVIRLSELQPLDPAGFTSFNAPDYDTLADSPLVMADLQGMLVRSFVVDRVPFRAVFFHNPLPPQDADGFVPVLEKVAHAENQIMGGPPYSHYDFLFDVGGQGGGLEHANSARLLLLAGEPPRGMDAFVAHEFFHLWNVKRIRPAVLGPFDYMNPPKTRNLWFAEGVTEYYAHIAVRRAGLIDQAGFLGHWRSRINHLEANPARKRISADDASLHVWESDRSKGIRRALLLRQG